jgi:hypothetical protein
MLGSLSEADDAVQETWLRLSRSGPGDVENLGGWLTTVVGRVCLDMLRSRTSRREEPLEAHLPDPIVSHAHGVDPEDEALVADSVAGRRARPRRRAPRGPRCRARGWFDRDPRLPAVAGQALAFQRFARFSQPALVNGAAGIVTAPEGHPISVMALTVRGGKIVAIDILADPERLRQLDLTNLSD